jgi:phosphoribosylformylglycinamidine cyclo-ligase
MPGMYSEGDYDLAGFCVGAVDRDKVLTGADIRPGDVIVGLASSGVHSNGFSLVRRIIADAGWDAGEIGAELLAPTKIYVRSLLPLVQAGRIHGLAHITGGGLLENIPRVLPEGCHAVVDAGAWQLPSIFERLQQGGNVAAAEMARTFNCGIGMVAIVTSAEAQAVIDHLNDAGETALAIGSIIDGQRGCTVEGPPGTWASGQPWTASHHA